MECWGVGCNTPTLQPCCLRLPAVPAEGEAGRRHPGVIHEDAGALRRCEGGLDPGPVVWAFGEQAVRAGEVGGWEFVRHAVFHSLAVN